MCGHVSASSLVHAVLVGGRFFDDQQQRWICPQCHPTLVRYQSWVEARRELESRLKRFQVKPLKRLNLGMKDHVYKLAHRLQYEEDEEALGDQTEFWEVQSLLAKKEVEDLLKSGKLHPEYMEYMKREGLIVEP